MEIGTTVERKENNTLKWYSVYSAVRTGSLNKAVCGSYLES